MPADSHKQQYIQWSSVDNEIAAAYKCKHGTHPASKPAFTAKLHWPLFVMYFRSFSKQLVAQVIHSYKETTFSHSTVQNIQTRNCLWHILVRPNSVLTNSFIQLQMQKSGNNISKPFTMNYLTSRDDSFLRAAEFQAKPLNLLFCRAAEFMLFRGICQISGNTL